MVEALGYLVPVLAPGSPRASAPWPFPSAASSAARSSTTASTAGPPVVAPAASSAHADASFGWGSRLRKLYPGKGVE